MSRNFSEHDYRGPSTSKQLNYRPTYTMGRRRKFGNSGGFSRRGPKGFDPNGDVDMWAISQGFPDDHRKVPERFNPYSSKNQKRKNKKHSDKSREHQGFEASSWFKVTIPHGKKSGKVFILESIQRAIPTEMRISFVPVNFQFNGNAAEFYVESRAAASQIKQLSKRITTPDGHKMIIHTAFSGMPTAPSLDPDVLDVLKTKMSENYDPATHSLNMAKWYQNNSLKMLGLYLPLNRSSVFTAVIKIIKEHIPEIEVMNLSGNKLFSLEPACSLASTCKHLKFINLQNNRLRSISELNHLKGLPLTEIVLDGNPLCDDFKDKAAYISAVRERFPLVIHLDGHDLPPPIGFDLGNEDLPVSKKSFFAADEVKVLVIQFLDLYYSIYDSGDRSKLLAAYHEQASFSLCLSKNIPKTNQGSLGVYSSENRNLLIDHNKSEKSKLLRQGKLAVVNALQELPQTNHDPTSFSIDIFHVSPGLMGFSVIGVFKEVGAEINNAPLKTFSRTFVVVPEGPGFVIVNETLFIAHASSEQQGKAFKVPAPTPSPSPAPPEQSATEKQLMVIELSKQTGMNLDFSAKCLEENDWDFQRSLSVFMKFQSEGKLPPEAFIRI